MNLKTETNNGETLITTANRPDGVVLEPSYITYLRNQGYNIRDITARMSVPSSDGEHAYLLYKIKTYVFPKNSSLLDIADESQQIEMWVCSCPQFRFRETVDVSNGIDVTPDQCGHCKHIRSVDKVARAENDDQQETLL
jgi:hypothetical protein